MVLDKKLEKHNISSNAKIISASRRTDIPAFYSKWLINRIQEGFCHWINPFGGQVYRVSLEPSDIIMIVFWTRNPKPLMPYLDHLRERGFFYYFHFTINGYPRSIESHCPTIDNAIKSFCQLSEKNLPQELVHWRYDPILLSEITSPAYHLEQFERIAKQLKGYTRRCYFSFADFYGKTARNLKRVEREHQIHFEDPDLDEQRALVEKLCDIADGYGMTLYSCCNDQLIDNRVKKAHCIDLDTVSRLRPNLSLSLKKAPTRQDCGCIEATDIGAYDTCTFGCIYCYATNSRSAAIKRMETHEPSDTALWRPQTLIGVDLSTREYRPKKKKKETQRVKSKDKQQTLFSNN